MTSVANAQNVTASFKLFSFGENPAATATRDFAVISPQISTTTTQESITYDYSSTPDWKRETKIQRYDILMAGKGKTWVPEVFISQNNAKIKLTPTAGTNITDNSMSVNNYMANIAYRSGNKLNFGISIFNTSLNYVQNGSFFDSNGTTATYTADTKESIFGLGLGTTIFLTEGFALAAFYGKIFESQDNTMTTTSTSSEVTPGGNSSFKHEKIGFGFSYQNGSSKSKGFRTELTFFKMNFGSSGNGNATYSDTTTATQSLNNAQVRLAIEGTNMGYNAGLSLTRVYGRYINYRYFLDTVIAQFPYYYKPNDVISGFLGFKSSGGSSFGGFASYFKGNADTTVYGGQATADTTDYSAGLSYSYVF